MQNRRQAIGVLCRICIESRVASMKRADQSVRASSIRICAISDGRETNGEWSVSNVMVREACAAMWA